MRRFLQASLLSAMGLCAWGVEAGYNQDTPTESWSEVTGRAGSRKDTALVNGDYFGVRALKVYDYDSRACGLEVGQQSLNGGALGIAGKLKACEPKNAEAWKNLDVGDNLFITSIEVCSPGKDDARIRGVRVQSASIKPDGKLKAAKAKTEIKFPGCKTWAPKATCPKDSVATGLRASYDDAATGYTGFELRCHKLKETAGSD